MATRSPSLMPCLMSLFATVATVVLVYLPAAIAPVG